MTLIAAAQTPTGTWLGGDRLAGSGYYTPLAGPKVFRQATPDGREFAVGFAGSPRVAQVVLSVEAPSRADVPIHRWLTEYCNAILDRCVDLGTVVNRGSNDLGSELADESEILLTIDGHVVRIGSDLAWEESARGFECIGLGAATWQGAFEAYRECHDVIESAQLAWKVAQRHTQIGELVDEIECR